MPTTVEKELELDIVNPPNANAHWTNQDYQTGYQGVYRFTASGDALLVFKSAIPKNLAGTPAWNLVIHHAGQGTSGRVLLHVSAQVFGSGDTAGAPTVIVPNRIVGYGASGDRNITVLSDTNFDSLLALSAGKSLVLNFRRIRNSVSGDTPFDPWDLTLPPVLRCDVT